MTEWLIIIGQFLWGILYFLLKKSVTDLQHEAHHHTFFYNKEGEKVHEFISVHKHGGVINE